MINPTCFWIFCSFHDNFNNSCTILFFCIWVTEGTHFTKFRGWWIEQTLRKRASKIEGGHNELERVDPGANAKFYHILNILNCGRNPWFLIPLDVLLKLWFNGRCNWQQILFKHHSKFRFWIVNFCNGFHSRNIENLL